MEAHACGLVPGCDVAAGIESGCGVDQSDGGYQPTEMGASFLSDPGDFRESAAGVRSGYAGRCREPSPGNDMALLLPDEVVGASLSLAPSNQSTTTETSKVGSLRLTGCGRRGTGS